MEPQATAPTPAAPERPAAGPTMLGTLQRHGLGILRNALIAAVVLTAASFLLPNRFTSTTQLLPPGESGELSSLLSGASGLSGALALSRVFGLGGPSGTETYLGVLRSRTVNERLVRRFDLLKVYREKDVEKAGRKLRAHTAIQLSNEGFVKVAVTERDRRLAADLANAYAAELDSFMRLNSNTSAHERRRFVEKRLAETRADLAAAEDALRDYQVARHLPAAGGDIARGTEAVGELMAAKVTREVELGTLQGVARGANARADQLRAEIRGIDAQISRLPPVVMELGRLYRTVGIQEKVLLVLTEEYERARLMEQRDVPTVEVVDTAVPAIYKSQPKRSLIGLGTFVVVFAAGWALRWIREGALGTA
jgi:tyrosine-protein kinase Etk/Wzc